VSRGKAIRLKAVRKKEKGSKEELGTPPERDVRYGQAGTRNQELFSPT